MTTVFIVTATSGEYSDFAYENLGVTMTRKAAEKRIETLEIEKDAKQEIAAAYDKRRSAWLTSNPRPGPTELRYKNRVYYSHPDFIEWDKRYNAAFPKSPERDDRDFSIEEVELWD